MPGSPTRTLRRVAQLEQQSIELAHSVFQAAPAAFVEPDAKPGPSPFRRDPLRALWVDAVDKAMAASVAMEELGDHLRAKAGNGAVGPFEELRAGMQVPGTVAQRADNGEQRNGQHSS